MESLKRGARGVEHMVICGITTSGVLHVFMARLCAFVGYTKLSGNCQMQKDYGMEKLLTRCLHGIPSLIFMFFILRFWEDFRTILDDCKLGRARQSRTVSWVLLYDSCILSLSEGVLTL
jgi:hypothetical protein